MKNRHYFIVFIFLLSLTLLGCSSNLESKESGQNSNPATQTKEQDPLKPPDLIIQIGEETIRPTLGTYSWSRFDQDGNGQSVEAESEAPPKLVENHETHLVNKGEQVKFDFEISPKDYEIREWHGGNTHTYKELDLSIHEGVKVFEVLAHWEEGTASYAFLLEIK